LDSLVDAARGCARWPAESWPADEIGEGAGLARRQEGVMAKQHAFVVQIASDRNTYGLAELNQLLNAGWRVVRVEPFSTSGAHSLFACLVIAEETPGESTPADAQRVMQETLGSDVPLDE
jgi:hypothetical protein